MPMEILLRAAGIAAAGMVLAVLLKKQTPELGMLLALFVSCAVLTLCLGILGDIFDFLRDVASLTGLSDGLVVPVIKAAGVAVLTKISADICRDAKESGIAAGVETVGAVVGLYMVLPLFRNLLDMVRPLL